MSKKTKISIRISPELLREVDRQRCPGMMDTRSSVLRYFLGRGIRADFERAKTIPGLKKEYIKNRKKELASILGHVHPS